MIDFKPFKLSYSLLTPTRSEYHSREHKSMYHNRARKHRKNHCGGCGLKRNLHAHHCDGNVENNDEENIQTLCTYCHGFWHRTLKRLGLPVKGRMPNIVAIASK